jgi:hypothetical protein
MPRVWTAGVWTVKRGCEDAFVDAWRALLPLGTGLGGDDPVLLRDRERPNVFHSFGAWPSLETVARFRGAIRPHVGEMDPLLDGFETFTLDEVHPGG